MDQNYVPKHDDFQGLCDHAQEEAAELISAIAKVKRFGATNHRPDSFETNAQAVVREWLDLCQAVTRLTSNNAFTLAPLPPGRALKMNPGTARLSH